MDMPVKTTKEPMSAGRNHVGAPVAQARESDGAVGPGPSEPPLPALSAAPRS